MRILIIDDEQLVCDGMTAILKDLGDLSLEVRAVNSVAQGKRILRDFPPDLVVSDVEMPGGNGLELVEYLKERCPGVKIWMLSGYDDFQYVHTAFRLHVDDYLLKPVDAVGFQEMVRKTYWELEQEKGCKEIQALYDAYFPQENLGGCSPRMRELMEYIRANISHDVSLKKLTDVFGYSETIICNMFRQETGRTFMEYVTRVRLKQAFWALLSDKRRSVHQVALDLGYSSERQFFRMFKNATGITPTQLRRRYAEQQGEENDMENQETIGRVEPL